MKATTKCHACLWSCVWFVNPPDDAPCQECSEGEFYEMDDEAEAYETMDDMLVSKGINPDALEVIDP